MNFESRKDNIVNLSKQRNFAYVISAGLLITNLILAIKLVNHDEKWVLIPQFQVDQQYTIEGDHFNPLYIEHWAGALTQDFLTVNPYTVDRAAERFLKITSSDYGQVKPYIDAQVKEIKENQLSTTFYAKEFKIDDDSKTVEVTGSFMTWFGREKPPIIQTKTFIVGWKIGPKSTLIATKFEEKRVEA